MPVTSYTRGRSFEYERVHYHRANGAHLAVRIAGSRGPWDVLALYANRVVLEQCKRVPELTPFMEFRREREFLSRFRVPFGVEANLVVRSERGITRTFCIHAGTSPTLTPHNPAAPTTVPPAPPNSGDNPTPIVPSPSPPECAPGPEA